jgi:hypothetical protein
MQIIDIPMTLQQLELKGNEENAASISFLRVSSPYLQTDKVNVIKSRSIPHISTGK